MQAFNPGAQCQTGASIEVAKWITEVRNENADNLCWKLPNGTYIGRIMAYVASTTMSGITPSGTSVSGITALTNAWTVSGNTISTNLDLVVNGDLTANNGLTVAGPAEFNGPAVFKAMAEFIDRVIFNKDVEFKGRAIFNSDSGGFAQLAQGEAEIAVTFDQEYAEQPIITANPVVDKLDQATYDAQVLAATCVTTDTLEQCQTKVEDSLLSDMPTYVVTKKSTTGFTIKLSQPASQEVKFSWSAIAVSQAKTAQN